MPAHAFWTANAVVDPNTGTAMEYPQLKLGEDRNSGLQRPRAKSVALPKANNQICPLTATPCTSWITATFLQVTAAIKMHKVETHRIRFTVGGNRIDYKGKDSTPTADLETIKLLLNSTVSTSNAKMLTADIKFFYLGTPMDCYEYMRIPAKDIPSNIMEQYNLAPLVLKGHDLTEIQKGMYCGSTLKWDYVARTVDLSMPGYRKSPRHLPCRTSDASPTCSARLDCPLLWLQSPAHLTG